MTQQARVRVEAIVPGAPEAVFDAWVNPKKLARWFIGGKTSETEAYVCAHEGGCYFIVMKGEKEWPHAGAYLEVSPGKRLRFTWYTPATDFKRSDVEISLSAAEGGTRVAIVHEGLPAAQARAHHDGWAELLTKLEKLAA